MIPTDFASRCTPCTYCGLRGNYEEKLGAKGYLRGIIAEKSRARFGLNRGTKATKEVVRLVGSLA